MLAVLLAFGCAREGGGETGNPVVAELPIELRSSDPEAVAISSGAAGTVIEEAWVAFGAPAFVDGVDCERLGDFDYGGPTEQVVDLASEATRFELDVPEGDYCGLVVPLQQRTAELEPDVPDELHTHSIVLRGEREDGTPFLITHPEQDELELGPDGAAIEVGEAEGDLVLAFDVAIWMDGIDLDRATVGGDGVVRIDAEHNPELLDRFELNVECSLELFRDQDGDGSVSEDEPRIAHCIDE